MARQVGDLWPASSGTASFGAEQVGPPDGGFTGTPRPFNHMHMNSGVWHDPVHGASGVVRFNRRTNAFEASLDGGITYGPIALLDNVTLDVAYGGGNEINQNPRTLSAAAAASFIGIGQDPVVLKQTRGGGNINGLLTREQSLESASIVASGFSLTPDLRDTFAFTSITPGNLYMQASGTALESPSYLSIALGNVGSIVDDLAILATDAAFQFGARGILFSTEDGDGDIILSGEGTDGLGVGGQIALRSFANSGQFEYRFGPHQSWYMKTTNANSGGPFNDGFHPLVASGQIVQMISEESGGNTTLDQAYNNGNEISLDETGPVLIKTEIPVDQFVFPLVWGGENNYIPLAVSGVGDGDRNGYLNLSHRTVHLVGSGVDFNQALPSEIFIGYLPNGQQADTTPFIVTSGSSPTRMFHYGGVVQNTEGIYQGTAGSFDLTADQGSFSITTQSPGGENISIIAQTDLALDSNLGNINLGAFSASGEFEYRFGPYESWHWKSGYDSTGGLGGDGFYPIPHSGQIEQMILENSLQDINGETGPSITIIGTSGVDVRNTGTNEITVSGINIVAAYSDDSASNGNFTGFTTMLIVPVREDPGYTMSTGVITVPFTGWYRVDYAVNLNKVGGTASNTTSQNLISRNGSVTGGGSALTNSVGYGVSIANGATHSVAKGFRVFLDAGDTLQLQGRRFNGDGNLIYTIGSSFEIQYEGNY